MREIVVGVEGSAASEAALDLALTQAAATGRPLRAVHAWAASVWAAGPGLELAPLAPTLTAAAEAERQAAQVAAELLDKALARRAGTAPVTTSAQAFAGDAGRVLVEQGADAALLVVGGHGHGPLKSAVVGSATMYVLHHSRGPVMVVPESASRTGPARLVVGVDGSQSARGALVWGLDAARRHGCPLVAVHSWQLTTLPDRAPSTSLPPLVELAEQARAWLERELEAALPERHGVEVRAEVTHSGPAAGLMSQVTEDDLLVVGSRGRGGFARLLLGSVATQCAQHARGTVVVVREQENRLDG